MRSRRTPSKPDRPAPAGDAQPSVAVRTLSHVIERSTRLHGPAAAAYVRRQRDANPQADPADVVAKLEKRYLAAVMASGAAVGSTAALPGLGTLTALSAAAGETVVFLEATALFVLTVAEVHGVPVDHREQRRALVLAVLAGDDGRHAVADLIGPGRTTGAWLADGAAPLPALSQVNSRLLGYAVRRYPLRRGALTVGRALPMGVGAVVGGTGNRLMGKKVIANARRAFGSPPARWPVHLHLVPPLHDRN